MCKKNKSIEKKHDEQSKNLTELKIGDEVYCQNKYYQTDNIQLNCMGVAEYH